METYYCKRYRRSAPGQAIGIVTDEVKFSADDVAEAKRIVRGLFSGARSLHSHVDWERDFATLEDECGNIIAQWLDGSTYG
jgi:hypothetical protein